MVALDQLNLQDVTNGWQALAYIVSSAIVVLSGWAMLRTKRNADKDLEKAAPALEAAQQAADLGPAVSALSGQVAQLQKEVQSMTPIVRVKYPLALDHISTLHLAEPALTDRFPIPRTLREDMGTT